MTTYKAAGVDVDAGTELVRRLQKLCPDIGGFSGLYPLGEDYLVASTDGVGTKLKLAFALGIHHTIGIDLVAMNVNDILTSGAKPLFFLDYFATSKLDVDTGEQILKGILQGCREADCVLLGGETAEMPGFYQAEEYDLAGFTVGIVAKNQLIDGQDIQIGDSLVGISSSGVHSNGYSLVRKIVEDSQASLNQTFDESDKTLGEVLLTPTRIYVKKVLNIQKKYQIKGMAHITGGGFIDNIPRMFPKGLGASIEAGTWTLHPIFEWLQAEGNVADEEMYRTFNMGIGMVMAMSPSDAEALCDREKDCFVIGKVVNHDGEGILWS